jgi:hypothetical protein
MRFDGLMRVEGNASAVATTRGERLVLTEDRGNEEHKMKIEANVSSIRRNPGWLRLAAALLAIVGVSVGAPGCLGLHRQVRPQPAARGIDDQATARSQADVIRGVAPQPGRGL